MSYFSSHEESGLVHRGNIQPITLATTHYYYEIHKLAIHLVIQHISKKGVAVIKSTKQLNSEDNGRSKVLSQLHIHLDVHAMHR